MEYVNRQSVSFWLSNIAREVYGWPSPVSLMYIHYSYKTIKYIHIFG